MVGASRSNSGGVGHHAVLDRHVQIGAQQHAFAADLEVVDREKLGHSEDLSNYRLGSVGASREARSKP